MANEFLINVKAAGPTDHATMNVRVANADDIGSMLPVATLPTASADYDNMLLLRTSDNTVWRLNAAKDGWVAADAPTSGNVTGAASSTDGEIVLFDGITGKIVKGAGAVLSAAGSAIAAAANAAAQRLLLGCKEFSGFVNRTDSSIGMNGSNFEITTGSTYRVWSNGTRYDKTETASVAISNDKTLHYVSFDSAGAIQVSTSIWSFTDGDIPIAIVFKYGSSYLVFDERHGYRRDRDWHEWAHETIGARYQSGFAGVFDNTTLSVAQGVVHDEDIHFDSGGAKTTCALWYRDTGATNMKVELAVSTPYKVNAGTIQYDNAGTLTNVGANKFVNSYVYAAPVSGSPIFVLVGQAQHNSLSSAVSEAFPSILLSTAEWKLLYRVTYRNVGGTPTYIQAEDYRTVSSGPANLAPSPDHSALINRDAANSHPISAINCALVDAVASQDLAAGDMVNLYNNGGALNARKADASTNAYAANGFVLSAVTSGAAASVYPLGGQTLNTGVSGLTIGARYYLSDGTAGGITTTAPTDTGELIQYVGKAISATSLLTVYVEPATITSQV